MTTITTNAGGSITATSFSGNGAALTNITRANIAAGTPNSVLLNNGSGLLTSSTTLQPVNGGLGADFSGTGPTPTIVTSSSGGFQVGLNYSQVPFINAIVQRDSAGDIPLQITGGLNEALTSIVMAGTTTTNASVTGVYPWSIVQGAGTTAAIYAFKVQVSLISTIGGGMFEYICTAKNISGTATTTGIFNKVQLVDAALSATDVSVTIIGTNLSFNVIGLAGTTIRWSMLITMVNRRV